jgi:hypothetical protein
MAKDYGTKLPSVVGENTKSLEKTTCKSHSEILAQSPKDRSDRLGGLAGNRRQRTSACINTLKENWHKIYFVLAVGMAIFFYGVVVGSYDVFPHRIFRDAKKAFDDWTANYTHYTSIRPEKFLAPARHKGSGVTIYIPGKAYDGVTLITSMWDSTNGMELVDMNGSVLHRWRVSLNEIWPKSNDPDRQKQVSDWDADIDRALLYPNGEVVFTFDYEGLVKIDRCSRVLWKVPFVTHHSIYEDAEGNLWVPGRKLLHQPEKRLPLIEPPIFEDYILKISPDGRILEQISVLDVLYQSDDKALLFANGLWQTKNAVADISHMNDIKILEKPIAGKFPLFNAGDIMVSMRNLNLIVVLDRSTKKIKWSMTGPYIKQHDPHFLPNGRISVYDNRADFADGKILGGSRILSIDPVTRKVNTVYEGDARNSFFSNMQGEHQYLPNGNILITEPDAGRIFEVTPSGEVVWSYINRYDENEVYRVLGGTRYAAGYRKFTEGAAQCQ